MLAATSSSRTMAMSEPRQAWMSRAWQGAAGAVETRAELHALFRHRVDARLNTW
jgi:hypothetical protein